MAHATIGSISHGTLRTEDLLSSFADVLEDLVQRNADDWCSDEGRATRDKLMKLIGDARDALATLETKGDTADGYDEETAMDLVDALQDALNEFAPAYCYFGTNEGDGADFGFWPSMDAIEELQKFSDLADVPDGIEDDYVIVNDHGNVSVYGSDGKEIWAIV